MPASGWRRARFLLDPAPVVVRRRKRESAEARPFPELTTSLWIATSEATSFNSLQRDLEVDVAVIGAGITGVTAAVLLKRAGKRVALIEKNRILVGETGHTTAHLTEVTDAGAQDIVRNFGKEKARLVYASTREALERIAGLVEKERIRCGFRRVPAYLYTERDEDIDWMREEANASAQMGIDCAFTREVPLPFPSKGAVLYRNQAQFHPREYLLPLAGLVEGDGSSVFEDTHVTNIEDGEPCVVKTTSGRIRCAAILVAANVPISNLLALHTKLAAYRTYVIASRVESSAMAEGLFWDTDDPYHYTRTHVTSDGTFLIIGGEDHKTGREKDTEEPYRKLLDYARSHFGIQKADYRWSGQIIEPVDGLPYIGRNSFSTNVYVATGYSGVGMTNGTLAAMILSDLILGRENRYAELYDPTRLKIVGAVKDFVRENLDFPSYLVADRLTSHDVDAEGLKSIAPGEGAIVRLDGKKVAAHCDNAGNFHKLSAICTHLGCDVRWNTAERSWDCPCHGSRFSPTGEVINGTAVKPLGPIE